MGLTLMDLVNVYVPPIPSGDPCEDDFDADTMFSAILDDAPRDANGDAAVLMCGDFNAHHWNWNHQTQHPDK